MDCIPSCWTDFGASRPRATNTGRTKPVAGRKCMLRAPLGFFQLYQAWRKDVTGIVPSPLAFFWVAG